MAGEGAGRVRWEGGERGPGPGGGVRGAPWSTRGKGGAVKTKLNPYGGMIT
jgi:hypothetical protein